MRGILEMQARIINALMNQIHELQLISQINARRHQIQVMQETMNVPCHEIQEMQ